MFIGVPRESLRHEHRVGLNPIAVSRLTQQGHTVVVEDGAGDDARFFRRNYETAGAQIAYTPEEVYLRADIVTRVSPMSDEELELLKPGSTVCSFHHLAVMPRDRVNRFSEIGATLIGYEVIRDDNGNLPVLGPQSEIAGRMAVNVAAHLLQNESKGRGILLGNIPGVPPSTVLIVGAGTVGRAAARQAMAAGAHVILVDPDLRRLQQAHRELPQHCVTAIGASDRLKQFVPIADVIIGAILIPGERAPLVVTEQMVRGMKAGSVIVDVSIDQGGCVETSRPMTIDEPTFTMYDVVHYCATNMPANVARTASRALANAAFPYVEALANKGLDAALGDDPGLAAGTYVLNGELVHAGVTALGVEKSAPR